MELVFNVIEGYEWMPKPKLASKSIPQWFKEMPDRLYEIPTVVTDGENEETILVDNEFPHGTAKLCSPFVDALATAYIIPLPMQVFVRAREDQKVVFSWNPIPGNKIWNPVGEHHPAQIPGLDLGIEEAGIFKFQIPWSIELPEGYAALYTHPLNRPDLPFQSFSGVIDSGYNSPVNIPFIWIAGPDHAGLIDAGTPIAQVIPFKLEEWNHSFKTSPESEVLESSKVASAFVTGYRRIYRKVKTWR